MASAYFHSASERGKFFELNPQPSCNAWNDLRSERLLQNLLILQESGEEGPLFCELQTFALFSVDFWFTKVELCEMESDVN